MKHFLYTSQHCSPRQPILIDVMSKDGRFIDQIRYTRQGFPNMVGGRIVEVHDLKDIESFVFEKRPSLRDKNVHLEISEQKIFV